MYSEYVFKYVCFYSYPENKTSVLFKTYEDNENNLLHE